MEYVKDTYNYTYKCVYDFIFAKKCILVLSDGTQLEYKNLSPGMPLGDLIELIIEAENMIGRIRNDMSIFHDMDAIHLYDIYAPLSLLFKSRTFYFHVAYLHANDFMKTFEQYRYLHTSSV